MKPNTTDGLGLFLPAVSSWFRERVGAPTPAQVLGWPSIREGRNTLICAPTGSGKTLAAFLACLDHLWRDPDPTSGVRVLYVSPLKALNEDIRRNLEVPLAEIRDVARARGEPLRSLGLAVRTGDTPQAERQRQARRPPEVLITTPESLHLLLTSRAREGFRGVGHVIVDEIHALAGNKRGVFLSLLLERLAALNSRDFVRVGLTATVRPLDEAARFLGGGCPDREGRIVPRPVSIVDAGRRKGLDLEVSMPDLPLGGGSIWPAIEERLFGLIGRHRSTLVFVNNRRLAERLTARLNDREGGVVDLDEAAPDEASAAPPSLAASHHGSLSTASRRSVEEALKAGALRAVVATASLEMGIDMGAIELVCQVESPGNIARGLQRVGRAGHLVGATSKGRLLAKTAGDLLESAALARAMVSGEVEPLRVPMNALDVLAQQVVACVAMDRWEVPELYAMVRRAYPYRDLAPSAFEAVLELVSGRYQVETFRDLRPRVAWDRLANRLHALPGTQRLALTGGGAIPDTGQFPVVLGDGGPRLGELDEEFVLERRVGDTFVFGTATWRITAIEPSRVIVQAAEGQSAQMPFWRGESGHRSGELGGEVGALVRSIVERADVDPLAWLRSEHHLDEPSARRLMGHVARQVRVAGAAPDDRTVLVESFRDEASETMLAVLSPWGGRFQHALKIVLAAELRRRLGIDVAAMHGDDGILFRLPGGDDPPTDVLDGLTPDRAESLLRAELPDSALFGLRFRQAAGRALLMPRPDPSKRTPLWLQRLRARDLLQAARSMPDFPIVAEAFREVLDDDLDLPRLRQVLDGVASGSIRVVERRGEVPSPFASELLFAFSAKFLYEWDEPKKAAAGARAGTEISDALLDGLLGAEDRATWLDPTAIGRVEGRLRGHGRPPRTPDEMAERLRALGDLTDAELDGPMAAFLAELKAQGRAERLRLETTVQPDRWILSEEKPLYLDAFDRPETGPKRVSLNAAREGILRRFIRTRALVTLDEMIARYPIDQAEASVLLESWSENGGLVRVDDAGQAQGLGATRWADRRNLDDVRRTAIALQRRESVAVGPEAFADFLARRQRVHPETRLEGRAALDEVLDALAGHAATAEMWEEEILPRRVKGFRPAWLDDAIGTGAWWWRARGDRVAILPRGANFFFMPEHVDGPDNENASIDDNETKVRETLQNRGARFADEIASDTGLGPSRLLHALASMARRGLVTNDRFEPMRASFRGRVEALEAASMAPRGRGGGPRRRGATGRPSEGRWSWVEPARSGPEARVAGLLAWVDRLLARYGVLCRETHAIEQAGLPPWPEMAAALNALELRGEVRRGFFVEGLSGVQYADAETAEALPRIAATRAAEPPLTLLSTLDPANLYGSGAPLDVPLLEGGTARLVRSPSNWLVQAAGRPVLIIEGQGKRLTGLDSASERELRGAVALLPSLAGPSLRILRVETYNQAPVLASPAVPWLTEAGLVRDLNAMSFYAGEW